jgi:hypothetical protein
MSRELCILVPVWHQYRWLAPLTFRLLEAQWPDHPPIYFAGLTSDEAGSLPHVPVSDVGRRTNWSWMTGDGMRQISEKGYDLVYLIAEEHVPLGPCHPKHLNETLPQWLDELSASYIGLMGWDNRRYPSRSPRLSASRGCMMHLNGPGDPRFHLHPALWRGEALAACCALAGRNPDKNGSAWHFEKVNDKLDAPLEERWKRGCYQVAARRASLRPPGRAALLGGCVERFVFNKLMALYPHIPGQGIADAYAHAVGFDDFFCDGPYPMFYSGLMVKGSINPYCEKFLRRTPEGTALLAELRKAQVE